MDILSVLGDAINELTNAIESVVTGKALEDVINETGKVVGINNAVKGINDAIDGANKFVKDNTGVIDVIGGLNKANEVINDGINKLSKVTGYENIVKELQNVHYSIVDGGYNNRSLDTWNNENIDSHYYVTPDNSEITLF